MNRTVEVVLKPEEAFDPEVFSRALVEQSGIHDDTLHLRPIRRSIDARGKKVVVRVLVEIVPAGQSSDAESISIQYQDVTHAPYRVVIVGAGPAGLFAALRLIELGIKPIVVEQGKDVQARRRDLAAINQDHVVDPQSNYCFGEGGAGTYSDGKLYTRSKKRGDVKRILEILMMHGAPEEIGYDAHPHVGTNKLPKLVTALSDTIRKAGGEIHFQTKVIDLTLKNGALAAVLTDKGEIEGSAVILATGHSARDIFNLLHRRNILIEAKPFALGVRVEHAQSLIDTIQYHCSPDRGPYLPASSYALVHQVKLAKKERGVFSFCMCPGGFIVPSATAPGEIVVNGMSPSRRDSRFANSGIVVEISLDDVKQFAGYGPLAAMHFQSMVEQKAFAAGGGTQRAPAQRLLDFVNGKVSASLLETSYQPGLESVDMRAVLPDFVGESLLNAFRNFGDKMKGYLTNDAQIIGVESRTSSPVKIPRDKETGEHPQVKGLFPCGEGAGFAGGIVSAAMDGERSAEAVWKLYFNKK